MKLFIFSESQSPILLALFGIAHILKVSFVSYIFTLALLLRHLSVLTSPSHGFILDILKFSYELPIPSSW